MIHLILGGGLGNQMFQYAFARSLALQYNENISFNTILYKELKNEERSFSLGHLNINTMCCIVETPDENKRIWELFNKQIFHQKIARKILPASFRWWWMSNRNIYANVCGPYKYYHPRHRSKNTTIIHGGFQSWKYFKEHQSMIKAELKVITPISEPNKKILKEIQNSNSICVHIRRGDFLSAQFSPHLEVCNKDYYEKAIKMISSQIENPTFFIFSNTHEDLVWIKKNYNIPQNSVYVDLNNPDYEELRLMYNCKHFILSNSSFSWWAQYLSESKNKIIIAPKIWDKRKGIDFSDIYMPEWIIIK